MPAAETVTLDRGLVLGLLIETAGVANALEWIAGSQPMPLTEELDMRLSAVADVVIEPWPREDDARGPRFDHHEAGHARGRELLAEIAGEDGADGR